MVLTAEHETNSQVLLSKGSGIRMGHSSYSWLGQTKGIDPRPHLDTKSAATACSQSCGEPGHHDHHGLTDALGGRVQGCSQPLRLGKAACCPEAFFREL